MFETYGSPFPFERNDEYLSRRKSDRFSEGTLYHYLECLGAPVKATADWMGAIVVERKQAG